MNKRVIATSLALVLVVSILSFSSVGANPVIEGIDSDRIQDLGEGIYRVQPTEEDKERYFDNFLKPKGITQEDIIPDNFDLSSVRDKIKGYELVKIEEETLKDGTLREYYYYEPIKKDKSPTVSASSTLDPGEGALRIYVDSPGLDPDNQFDDDEGYKSKLESDYYKNTFNFVSGTILSSIPVYGYFLSAASSDLDDGAYADGWGTHSLRDVEKNGQAYTNGAWKTYFIARQHETYWDHTEISYTDETKLSVIHDGVTTYWPSDYYPMEWFPTPNFNDHDYILNVTQTQYDKGASEPLNDGLPINHYSADDFAREGSFDYYQEYPY